MAGLRFQCEPVSPPPCPVCGVAMKLRLVEPNTEKRYRATDVHTFGCLSCGRTRRLRVARFTVIDGGRREAA